MLNNTIDTSQKLEPLVPLFWKITAAGVVSQVPDTRYRGDIYVRRVRCGAESWFEFTLEPAGTSSNDCAHSISGDHQGPSIFIALQGSVLGAAASSWGLVAIYFGGVYTIHLLVRSTLTGMGFRIQLEDMGERIGFITKLIEYIYESRMHINDESGKPDLELEEALYEALINMLRIPEFLMKETGFYKHSFPVQALEEGGGGKDSKPGSARGPAKPPLIKSPLLGTAGSPASRRSKQRETGQAREQVIPSPHSQVLTEISELSMQESSGEEDSKEEVDEGRKKKV